MTDRTTLKPVRPDVPEAGFYKGRMVRGGPWCPIRIWFGAPKDPVTGEELDRSHRWQAERNGEQIDVFDVWPYCAAHPIPRDEFDYMLATFRWAVEHAPEVPEAAPRSPINLNQMPSLF